MSIKNRLVNIFFHWLPLGGAILLLGGITVVTAQQVQRLSFNDPLSTLTINLAPRFNAPPPYNFPTDPTLNISTGMNPFVGIYDSNGNPIAVSENLNGAAPKPPVGVFEYAKAHGENRVTWQPNRQTRIALVIRPTDNGDRFVLAGANMGELEKRIDRISMLGGAGILFTLVVTFILDALCDAWRQKKMAVHHKKHDHEEEKED